MLADDWAIKFLLSGVTGDQQLSLAACICTGWTNQSKVRAQGFTHFWHLGFQPSRKSLPFNNLICRVTKHRS